MILDICGAALMVCLGIFMLVASYAAWKLVHGD